ncbi:MAG TPA: hypothetical protein VF135_02370, partial [Terriglobales bacterium]
KSAMEWFLRAAKQGNPAATRNLVALYLHGHCMPVDYHDAYLWLLAAHMDDEWSRAMKEQCRKHMPESEIKKLESSSDLTVATAQ